MVIRVNDRLRGVRPYSRSIEFLTIWRYKRIRAENFPHLYLLCLYLKPEALTVRSAVIWARQKLTRAPVIGRWFKMWNVSWTRWFRQEPITSVLLSLLTVPLRQHTKKSWEVVWALPAFYRVVSFPWHSTPAVGMIGVSLFFPVSPLPLPHRCKVQTHRMYWYRDVWS